VHVEKLTDKDRRHLTALPSAARQIREASIVSKGEQITLAAAPGAAGYVDIFVRLLDNERFRSLALAVRLTTLQSELAHFARVCNVLARYAPPELKQRALELRSEYQTALREAAGNVRVDDGGMPDLYTTQQVFEHWVNGLTFHQDPDRQEALRRLETTGARFAWSVQSTTLLLAGRVLDLDDVVAKSIAGFIPCKTERARTRCSTSN